MPARMLHGALVVGALLAGSAPAPARPADRPNVVVVLADDLGTGDPRCYNPRSKVPTPHLDRLAREGARFTDAHSPSGVCTPTRYGLLTGRYAWRTSLKRGVLWGDSPLLVEEGRATLASMLAAAGYATGGFGKWHLGLGRAAEVDWTRPLRPGPLELGFERYFGIPASLDMQPYVYVDDDRPLAAVAELTPGSATRREGGGGFWRPGPIAPGFVHEQVLPRCVDAAIEWIEAQAGGEAPFFAYVALPAPHTPWLPLEASRGESRAGWYGDFAHTVDAEVGRLLAALDRLGVVDDTLVVFTSDNGAHWTPSDVALYGHQANLELRGQKADAWEGGHRVPFLVRWPGRTPAGAVRDDLLCLTDLFATLAAVVGAPLAEDQAEDSFDLSPALRGAEPDAPLRPTLVMHSFEGLFAVREGDWKLIEGLGSGGFTPPYSMAPGPGGPRGQLYDLAADPREAHNLWLEEPERVARLAALLDRARRAGRTRGLPADGR